MSEVDLKVKYTTRIAELQVEIDEGTKALQKLATQSENLRAQLLRIQGAQMLLREMLKDMEAADKAPESKTV